MGIKRFWGSLGNLQEALQAADHKEASQLKCRRLETWEVWDTSDGEDKGLNQGNCREMAKDRQYMNVASG